MFTGGSAELGMNWSPRQSIKVSQTSAEPRDQHDARDPRYVRFS
jgi:hypothetical protein